MRVCLVSIHPRLLSGQINSLIGLAHALRDRGHQVRLVTAFAEARLLDSDRVYGPEAHAGLLPAKLARIGKIIKRLQHDAQDADVVHLNLPTPAFSFVGDLVQAMLNRPIVVGFEAHLLAGSDYRRLPVRQAPNFYLPWVAINNHLTARLSRFSAAQYVVASQLQADELQGLGAPAERIRVIPNLIDLQRIREDTDYEVDGVDWSEDGPVISYIGHFNHVKGVDVLIRAFPRVLENHPNARLLIAWSGLGPATPIAQAIEASGASDRIQVIGRVPVGAVLRHSTAFVLPYRFTIGQAAYPGLVLEALASGVPLVTSDLPLLRELGEPGEVAELARPEDPADLARAILRLLDDPQHRAGMVTRQQALVNQSFDPDVLVRRYEDVYGQPSAVPAYR